MGAKLIDTIRYEGMPSIYIYEHDLGWRFGVHRTYRTSPTGWLATLLREDGGWGDTLTVGYRLPQTRKSAVVSAVEEINWRLRGE